MTTPPRLKSHPPERRRRAVVTAASGCCCCTLQAVGGVIGALLASLPSQELEVPTPVDPGSHFQPTALPPSEHVMLRTTDGVRQQEDHRTASVHPQLPLQKQRPTPDEDALPSVPALCLADPRSQSEAEAIACYWRLLGVVFALALCFTCVWLRESEFVVLLFAAPLIQVAVGICAYLFLPLLPSSRLPDQQAGRARILRLIVYSIIGANLGTLVMYLLYRLL